MAILDAAARTRLLDAISNARASGARIAFDPNYRARLWPSVDEARRCVSEALTLCDIALPTFLDEAELFGDASPESAARRIASAGVQETIVKNGSEPACLLTAEAHASLPAIAVENPVDTTGAGDGFNGAYLAARLAGKSPEEAASCAHKVAAAVVRTRGALAPATMLHDAYVS